MHTLALVVPAASVEAISDALSDTLGALSVSVQDADAGSADEQPVFDEPGLGVTGTWQRARLDALFASEEAAVRAAAWISAEPGSPSGPSIVGISALADDDWVRASQAQFGATEVVPGFWVVPSWCDIPAGAHRSIRLDPGRAFGTGTHPTTLMCLRWIARQGEPGASGWQRVLDYGAGSGILAIAAALLGARAVDAVDLDAAAIEATRLNAEANGVAVQAGLPDLAHGHYRLIVANILATPLKLLAPLLSGLLDDGATLLLSGILERQAHELAAAYAPWLELRVADAQDGWVLLAGVRAQASAAGRMA